MVGRALLRPLTAAFVLYHAATVVLLSVPAPSGARSDAVWNDPFTRKQVLGWLGWLVDAGVFESPDALFSAARAASVAVMDARELLLSPFAPYARAVGANQSWQMFATLNDEPARLSVELRWAQDGEWEPLYIARDPVHDWRREQLDEERVRAFLNDYSWERDRAEYKLFARWLAREIAAEMPEAESVRVSMLRARLPTPEELRLDQAPAEKPTWIEIFRLAPLRAEAGP